MAKWILAKNNRPPEYRELLCIFITMPDDVWHARREGEKYFGSCLDGEDLQEINGELLCWKPWPASPFRLAAPHEKSAQEDPIQKFFDLDAEAQKARQAVIDKTHNVK